jgi:hypothetical protein
MAAGNGYIKLHRSLLNWEWYHDPNTMRVFIHLLLWISHEETTYKGYPIRPGQYGFTIPKIASELQLTNQQTRTSLSKLKSTGEITVKTTNKYSIITIVNWELYQGRTNKNNSQNNSQNNNKTTDNISENNRQINTGLEQEDKEEQEYNKELLIPPISPQGELTEEQKIIIAKNIQLAKKKQRELNKRMADDG